MFSFKQHPKRVRSFYKKAVDMHSNKAIYAAPSYFGIGTFTRDNLKMGDTVMEVSKNYTVSSFDHVFPHMEEVNAVVNKYETNPTNSGEIHMLRLILNLNYMRFHETDRYFKIWFNNIPDYPDYLPYWDDLDKKIMEKFLFMPTIKEDLYLTKFTVFEEALKDTKKALRDIDPNYLNTLLTNKKVEFAINLIKTRSLPISLKGHKILQEQYKKVKPEDINEVGLIIIPGVDAVNHESHVSEDPDLSQFPVLFNKGKAIVKAARDFKKGEEFLFNYNPRFSVIDILKNYGFVPIETMLKTTVFKNEYFDLSKANLAFRKLCIAIGACYDPDSEYKVFNVPKLTNTVDMAKINLERIKAYYEKEITDKTVMDVYTQIAKNQHDPKSEFAALSTFLNDYYGGFLYAKSFRKDIDSLLELYQQNEDKETSIAKMLEGNDLKINADEAKLNIDRKDRFREILKFCFLNHHNVTVNIKGGTDLIDLTADRLLEDLKKEMIYELS